MVWPPLEGWGAACFLGTTRRLPRFQQRTSNPKHHERQWKDLEGQVNDSSRLYMMLLLSNTIPQNHPVLLLYMYTPLPRGKLASPSHTTSDLTSVPRDPQLWLGLFDQPLPGPPGDGGRSPCSEASTARGCASSTGGHCELRWVQQCNDGRENACFSIRGMIWLMSLF